jgi:hypothetical protein
MSQDPSQLDESQTAVEDHPEVVPPASPFVQPIDDYRYVGYPTSNGWWYMVPFEKRDSKFAITYFENGNFYLAGTSDTGNKAEIIMDAIDSEGEVLTPKRRRYVFLPVMRPVAPSEKDFDYDAAAPISN